MIWPRSKWSLKWRRKSHHRQLEELDTSGCHQYDTKRANIGYYYQSSLLSFLICSYLIILLSMIYIRPVTADTNKLFHIATLCTGKSIFPVFKKVEGAVLTSDAESDVNCTITFQTDTVLQHFMMRFENLKLGCGDHLYIYDGAHDYGRVNIADLSCRNNLANVEPIRTTGNYLTLRYSADKISNLGDGFRLVITAVKSQLHECPYDARCLNQLCISQDLLCDGIDHCGDNSDETSHSNCVNPNDLQSIFSFGHFTTNSLLFLLAAIFLILSSCVIGIALHLCRRETHYATYQHHLQRMVPLQTSSSLMLNQHQILQASPYISANCTPQHIPREHYSTLPIHFDRFRSQNHQQQTADIRLHHQQQFGNQIGNNIGSQAATTAFALSGRPVGANQVVGTPVLQANSNYQVVGAGGSASDHHQTGSDVVKQLPPYNLVFIGTPVHQPHHQALLSDAASSQHIVLTTPGAQL